MSPVISAESQNINNNQQLILIPVGFAADVVLSNAHTAQLNTVNAPQSNYVLCYTADVAPAKAEGGAFSHSTCLNSTSAMLNDFDAAVQQCTGVVSTSQAENRPREEDAILVPKRRRTTCQCPNCRAYKSAPREVVQSIVNRTHNCYICAREYKKTSHLQAHIRGHFNNRPYVCSWKCCGKSFTRSDELMRHRRTHTGEKNFECQTCKKRFVRSDHLRKHAKTHLQNSSCNAKPKFFRQPQGKDREPKNLAKRQTRRRQSSKLDNVSTHADTAPGLFLVGLDSGKFLKNLY